MAVDMFLKFEKIKGESVDNTHKDTIDVLAWSWGVSQSGTTHLGPGGGAGKANFQDISITKFIDKSSPVLAQHCAKGTHIPTGTLIVRKAGDKPLEYIVMVLTDIIVTSVSLGGSGGEDRLTENVSLNFAKFEYKYKPQTKEGSGGAEVKFAFDISKNAE